MESGKGILITGSKDLKEYLQDNLKEPTRQWSLRVLRSLKALHILKNLK